MPGKHSDLGNEADATGLERAAARPPCILVAEDEDMVRDLAVRVLCGQGMRVLSARHGGEALALFQSHADEIDAVLLDLTMPVMGGAEVLVELKRLKPAVCVLVTSGYSETPGLGVDDGLHPDGGCVRFLQKPYRAQSLLNGIAGVLAASPSATHLA
jgi:two-component system, cell cycle sensor histidine kinase and response regulator CckA